MNEECLVGAVQHIALNTSLPFVHTARRIKERNRCNEAAERKEGCRIALILP